MSLHKDPLVHFALLGGLMFGLWTLAHGGRVGPPQPAAAARAAR